MKTAAIIAEYNPFHNGHRYLAEAARKQTDADYVIAVMSGCFVQRGEPALLDKYIRADFALHGGVDLVLELPAVYSLGNADQFAAGAVRILDALGCDYLCFGCESDNLPQLSAAAALFDEEPDDFWEALSDGLKEGLSYPAAREHAAAVCLPERNPTAFPDPEEVSALLRGSNNILAISYLQAIRRTGASMEPVPVLRIGSGHQDIMLPDALSETTDDPLAGPAPILLTEDVVPGTIKSAITGQTRGKVPPRLYPSAASIRYSIADSIDTHRFLSEYPALRQGVSTYVYQALQDARTNMTFQFADDYSTMLRYRLLQMRREEFLSYCGQNESFANRLLNHVSGWQTVTELCEAIKHKSRTYTGISRTLFRILLGLDDTAEVTAQNEKAYARVLGMREDAGEILHVWNEQAKIPVLVSLSSDAQGLTEAQAAMLRTDIFASDLYAAVQELKTGTPQENEYTRRFLTVEDRH